MEIRNKITYLKNSLFAYLVNDETKSAIIISS